MKNYETYPSHKDSGEPWIGDTPSHWKVGKLGNCLKPFSDKGHPDEQLLSITRELGVIERDAENDEENHNFIPDDLSGYKLLKKGQFGMNKMKAWQGSYGVSKFTGIVSPAYFTFNLRQDIVPEYFHIAVRSKGYVPFFGRASDGVRIGQWDLSKSRMKEIPFLIPPPAEQTAIANFLDDKTAKIDKAIAQKEQLIALLGERKQIIIQNAVTKGLDPTVKMKPSGIEWIGEIPEHWEVKKTKHFGRISSGESIVNSELTDEGDFEVYGGNGVMGYSNKFNIEGDTIVIGRVGALCGNVRHSKQKRWISDNALILKLSKGVSYEYQSTLLAASNLNSLNSSNAQPLVTGTKVMNHPIPMPPKTEQLQILGFIRDCEFSFSKGLSSVSRQIQTLREYRATLIDSAVTGKIKVS